MTYGFISIKIQNIISVRRLGFPHIIINFFKRRSLEFFFNIAVEFLKHYVKYGIGRPVAAKRAGCFKRSYSIFVNSTDTNILRIIQGSMPGIEINMCQKKPGCFLPDVKSGFCKVNEIFAFRPPVIIQPFVHDRKLIITHADIKIGYNIYAAFFKL